jgi:hypothetical protein
MSKSDELRYGAPGETAVHICVDMQRMFAEATQWKMPWLERVLPSILAITSAHPERTIFTRFIPAQRPGHGVGMWRHYYERWGSMTIDELGPEMIGLVPELARFVPPARIFDKHVYSPWTGTDLHQQLHRAGIDTVTIGAARPMSACSQPCGLGIPRHSRDGRLVQLCGRNPRRHDEYLHEPVWGAGRDRDNPDAAGQLAQ